MQKFLPGCAVSSFAVFLLLALFAVGCHKSSPAPSSPEYKEQLLAWNLNTTVGVYSNAGSANLSWDEPARQCLTEFARAQANALNAYEPANEIISTNAEAAMNAGCNDPMVKYLFLRYAAYKTKSNQDITEDLCKLAQEMQSSSYPPFRNCQVAARALGNVYDFYDLKDPRRHNDLNAVWTVVYQILPAALADKKTPSQEIDAICERLLYLSSGSAKNHDGLRDLIDKSLSQNWPDSYLRYLLKAENDIDAAWKARGNGYSDSVTQKGWEGFRKGLGDAQAALEHAWKLNSNEPKIAETMMNVMLGQGGGRDRMELWFNRAMQLNTNDYTACRSKLLYLEPKWYGSDADELAFGRECVQSTNWGGRVPLILVDAHINIDSRNKGEAHEDYWQRPDVWADVQAAYERFFALNPGVSDTYKNYLWYAFAARQWDKVNELIPKIDPDNYKFFGGQDAFNKMVEIAKNHGQPPDENK